MVLEEEVILSDDLESAEEDAEEAPNETNDLPSVDGDDVGSPTYYEITEDAEEVVFEDGAVADVRTVELLESIAVSSANTEKSVQNLLDISIFCLCLLVLALAVFLFKWSYRFFNMFFPN